MEGSEGKLPPRKTEKKNYSLLSLLPFLLFAFSFIPSVRFFQRQNGTFAET